MQGYPFPGRRAGSNGVDDQRRALDDNLLEVKGCKCFLLSGPGRAMRCLESDGIGSAKNFIPDLCYCMRLIQLERKGSI